METDSGKKHTITIEKGKRYNAYSLILATPHLQGFFLNSSSIQKSLKEQTTQKLSLQRQRAQHRVNTPS
jgi:hypothetical protein